MVRAANLNDATACATIYAPYVTDTVISFETEPPSVAEMAQRMEASIAWYVLEQSGRVVGYAYASPFHKRAAYRWSVEVSVYVEMGLRRSGAGRALYSVLLDELTARGYRNAMGGMTLPNAASEGLHRAMGFEPVGVYRRVGYKNGEWWDVAWTQRVLSSADGPPAEPA
jgi:phosphinothricin acetyltransferase